MADRDEVWIVDPGSLPRRLTDRPGAVDFEAAFSPDGTDLQRIATTAEEDTDPSFSPDGRFIVFSSDAG